MERQATIIQADAAAFKNLVQKLTGAPARRLRPRAAVCRRSPFKLHERRKHALRELEVIEFGNTFFAPEKGGDSASSERGGPESESPCSEEERNIAEKGFYLHASPVKAQPPVLLTLFPLTSPKEF